MSHWKILGTGIAALAIAVFVIGCGGDTNAKSTDTKPKDKTATSGASSSSSAEVVKSQKEMPTDGKAEKKVDDHSGWWCSEHGIPEEECSMCSDKVGKEAKAKGDWCEKHERAMSQCFICKPDRREFYAAKYRAKYGKEPPKADDQEEKKETKKG